MFDTYPRITEYVTKKVDITQNRAPTDDSVRLFKEFEEKARASIFDSIRVSNTSFEGVVHCLHDDANCEYVIHAMFSLNGKKLQATIRHSMFSTDSEKFTEEVWEKLHKEVASVIAAEILPAFMKVERFPR